MEQQGCLGLAWLPKSSWGVPRVRFLRCPPPLHFLITLACAPKAPNQNGDDVGCRYPLAWASAIAIRSRLGLAPLSCSFSPWPHPHDHDDSFSLLLFIAVVFGPCPPAHLCLAQMSPTHSVQAPTSSLPLLRNSNSEDITKDRIASALRNLTDIYCPLPRAASFSKPSLPSAQADYLAVPASTTSTASSGTATPLAVDSGYASGEDDDEDACGLADEDELACLRADSYERQFAVRWLTSFIARAEELLPEIDDDARQHFIDEASYILASFSSVSDAEQDEDAGAIVREFRFQVNGQEADAIEVRLTDGTPATGSDHTDVGLQSWGASIVVSDLMCSFPERFGLSAEQLGDTPRIIELGAGTGLVGITMAKLLPRIGVSNGTIIATDYHPAVLSNLKENITANFPRTGDDEDNDNDDDDERPLQTCLLDWAAPCLDPPLHEPADMLVATDVVYAPEHAVWLRDCAGKLLAHNGIFWLIASVRPNGRFEGVTDTVEAAFADEETCPTTDDGQLGLRIVAKDSFGKRKGVGRADEIGYKVFRIGWEEVDKTKRKSS